MKALPQITQLLTGVSPLVVFGCRDFKDARRAFYELRKKYDFPYWAALEYMIPDKENPKCILPLRLNRFQFYLADVFIKRANAGFSGKYIISKSVPKCGLTSCVQAYILWLQLYRYSHHSITCTESVDNMNRLKSIVAECIHKPSGSNIVSVKDTASSLFQSIYDPHVLDRCPSSYVHLADMSKWPDPTSELSLHIYSNAYQRWNATPASLFVLEGDTPSHAMFRAEDYRNYLIQESFRLMQLRDFFSNPYFVNRLVIASDPKVNSEFHYINLDQAL